MTVAVHSPNTDSAASATRMSLPPNLRILLDVVLGAGDATSTGGDWNEIVRLAKLHGLLPHVHQNLRAGGAPDAVRLQVAQLVLADAAENFKQTGNLLDAIDILRHRDIRALTLKGAYLALSLYGDLQSRTFSDIDLFIDRADVQAAHAALTARGYCLVDPSVLPTSGEFNRFLRCTQDKDYVFRSSDGAILELHWSLLRSGLGRIVTFEEAWAARRTVSYKDTGIDGLDDAHQVVYLAAHGTLHRWCRLEWLYSFSILASRMAAADWERALRLARERRLSSILALALHLAGALDFNIGDRAVVGAPPVPDRLLQEAIDVLSRRDIREEYHRGAAFYIEAKGDTLESIVNWSRRLAMPSHKDLAALPPLFRRWPYYYAIRPARLVAQSLKPKSGGPG